MDNPTHYAVIDEHGEIIHASRILSYRDAQKNCQGLIDRMAESHPEAKDWTVKGVMVHDD